MWKNHIIRLYVIIMPNKEETVKIREKAIEEVSKEIEKVEEFLKKGATELYVEVITPDIENSANNNLFTDLGITIDYANDIHYSELYEKLFNQLESLNLNRIKLDNSMQFLKNSRDPILYFMKEEDEYIFYRKSYLQEIVEKDGYAFEPSKEDKMYTISASLPTLERDEYGKVLIKKD